MRVDLAGRDDAGEVIDLLLRFHSEHGLAPIEPTRMVGQVCLAIDLGNVLVARENGCIIGALGLHESGFWYSDATLLSDLFFYVRPESRGKAGALLLKHAKKLSDARSVPIVITVTNVERSLRRQASRWGYVPLGSTLRLGRWGTADVRQREQADHHRDEQLSVLGDGLHEEDDGHRVRHRRQALQV